MDETSNEFVTPDAIANKVRNRICLNCGRKLDDLEQYRRGLCPGCYQQANRADAEKLVSWAELEKKGVAVPATKGGRPRKRKKNTVIDQLIRDASNRLLGKGLAIAKSKKKRSP